MPFEACTQPECHLREPDVDCRSLAELIVRVLAGQDVDVKSPIQAYDRCVDCARRVLEGKKPLPTVEEVERSLEAAKWSYRRARRRVQRDAHSNLSPA